MTSKKSRLPRPLFVLLLLLLCGLAVGLVGLIFIGFEGEVPTFQLQSPIQTIGTSHTLKAEASDQKSGLRRVWIAVLQHGKERTLLDKTFPSTGYLRGGVLHRHSISLDVNSDILGLEDGEALLRTAVWDYSYRDWWTGNRGYAEYKILIDTKPPTINVLTRVHNLNQGGTGLAIYEVSEDNTVSGVQVGDVVFPGYSGLSDDPRLFMAFFALPYDKGPDTALFVTATDMANNTSKAEFPHHINTRSFKKDTITLSDGFLKRKMPEFADFSDSVNPSAPLIDRFVAVNRYLRQANHETLVEASKQTDATLYWKGAFLRLPGSAQKAGFADRRRYVYEGKTVDKQVHLGIDLASTGHSPVPAANNGRVALAEYVGIYGKTVILDHGFGLFSMYGHLSRIQVARDQVVSKGDVIGFTGMTGLAGGDHLHYSMMVGHTFVNPIEWWDPIWIKHNVTGKLEAMKSLQLAEDEE
ncbi:MAG: M23 family metallopeptidase [Deltaproteobacteria bacterium]|nr:M23 family metallopeptidase [Deltaproteobacteria bacterium]MBW2170869.1 M23 family metallopeptidase [Deltaproteobacteria bacterium]